jgi:hypothetical protein
MALKNVIAEACIKVFLTDPVSELYGQRLYCCDPGTEVMLPLQVLFSTTVTNKGREHVKLMMEYLFVYHPPTCSGVFQYFKHLLIYEWQERGSTDDVKEQREKNVVRFLA